MPSFLRKLVQRFAAGGAGHAPQVFLGIFGKHPGADDHFEYWPPDSRRLAFAWDLLYEQGIKNLVPEWRQFGAAERLAEFKHVFIWQMPDSIIAGRLWSSTDGVSRGDFPLVVCAECHGLSVSWVIRHVLPALEEIEARCKATRLLSIVREAVDAVQGRLTGLASQPASVENDQSLDAGSPLDFASRPQVRQPPEGLLRILYHIDRDLDGPRQLQDGGPTPRTPSRTQQLRVPSFDSVPGSIGLWLDFLSVFVDANSSLLTIAPVEQPWLDVIIGPVEPQQLLCLRASTEKIPLTSDIPYVLDSAFLAFYSPLVASSFRPPAPTEAPKPAQPEAAAAGLIQPAPSAPPEAPPPAPQPAPTEASKPAQLEGAAAGLTQQAPSAPPEAPPPAPQPAPTAGLPLAEPPPVPSTTAAEAAMPSSDRLHEATLGPGTESPSASEAPVPPPDPPRPARPSDRAVAIPGQTTPAPPALQQVKPPSELPMRPPNAHQLPFSALEQHPRRAVRSPLWLSIAAVVLLALVGVYIVVINASRSQRIARKDQPVVEPPPVAPHSQPAAPPSTGPVAATGQDPVALLEADPRIDWAGHKAFARLRENLAKLKDDFQMAPSPAVALASTDIEQRIVAVSALPWNATSKSHINGKLDGLSKDLVAALELADQQLRYAQWRSTVLAQTEIAGSPILNAEWAKRRNQILGAGTEPAVKRKAIESLQAALKKINAAFDVQPRIKSPGRKWSDAIALAAADENRARELQASIGLIKSADDGIASVDDTALTQLTRQYTAWRTDATALIADYARAEDLLSELHADDEQPGPDEPSIRQVTQKWEDRPILADSAVANAIAPLRQRAQLLLSVARLQDRVQLLDHAATSKDPAAIRAIWLRLCSVGRGQFSDLAAELGVARQLERAIDDVADGSRKRSLQDELIQEKWSLWQANFSLANDAAQVESLVKRMEAFRPPSSTLSDPRLQYNLLVYRLKKIRWDALTDAAMRQELDRFTTDAEQLDPAFRGSSQVAGFLDSIKRIGNTPDSPPVSPGPQSAGWQVEQNTGAAVSYSWTARSARKHVLQFLRIQPRGIDSPVFVCTTEMPLGLFADAVDANAAWSSIVGLLGVESGPAAADKMAGATVWQWQKDRDRITGMKPARQWMNFGTRYPAGHYDVANGINPDPPSWDHPIQQVSAPAAMLVATLLGCRLPTSVEWLQCQQEAANAIKPGQWNLRDVSWHVQHNFARAHGATARELPQCGIFLGEQAVQLLGDSSGQEAEAWPNSRLPQAVRTPGPVYQDGVLWFRPVQTANDAAAFRDLVGNVAEFVYDDLAFWKNVQSEPPQSRARRISESLSELVAARKSAVLAVIGGSALSPPQIAFDRPLSLLGHPHSQITSTYADVGFRLTFDAPAPSAKERMRELLLRQDYVYAGKRMSSQ